MKSRSVPWRSPLSTRNCRPGSASTIPCVRTKPRATSLPTSSWPSGNPNQRRPCVTNLLDEYKSLTSIAQRFILPDEFSSMRLVDYLVFRTPHAHLGVQNAPQPGTIPGSRVALSLLGLIIGIVASFFVTGIRSSGTTLANQHKTSAPPVAASSETAGAPQTTNSGK